MKVTQAEVDAWNYTHGGANHTVESFACVLSGNMDGAVFVEAFHDGWCSAVDMMEVAK